MNKKHQKEDMLNNLDDWDQWNKNKSTQSGFLQTRHWANLNHAANGTISVIVETPSASICKIGALFSLDGDSTNHRILRAFRAPIIANNITSNDINVFLNTSEKRARDLKAIAIRFDGFPAPRDWSEQTEHEIHQFLIKKNYQFTPWMTSIIDLTVGTEAMFNGFKHSLRKGIRKCEKDGIRVEECDSEDHFIKKFWHAYYDSDQNDDRARLLWNHPSSSFYKYFVALDASGTVLACLGAYEYNGVVTEIMSQRTVASYKIKAPVQDYLHWEMFKAYMKTGARYFDLAGYNPNPIDSKEAGIAAFKTKWGGTEFSIPIYTKDLRPFPIRMAISSLKSVRSKILNK